MNAVETIRFVAGQDREVEIRVTRCMHTCCGGGWTVRERDQVYVGKVLDRTTEHTFVLRSAPLGRIQSVLVEFKHLVSARFEKGGA